MDFWKREPVRTAVYPTIVIVAAFLVQRGIIDADTQAFVLALATLIVGALGAEVARSKVSPVDKS